MCVFQLSKEDWILRTYEKRTNIFQDSQFIPGPMKHEYITPRSNDVISQKQQILKYLLTATTAPNWSSPVCSNTWVNRMFIGPCIIVIVEDLKTNLMSLVVFISLIFAQHVSNINMSIFRSLRLRWWLTTSVILFCKDRCCSNQCTLQCVMVRSV